MLRLLGAQSPWLQQLCRGFHGSGARLFPDIHVPPLGESISEGSVAALLVKPGDAVNVDDAVAELETDKVTVSCKASHAGTVEKLLVSLLTCSVAGCLPNLSNGSHENSAGL